VVFYYVIREYMIFHPISVTFKEVVNLQELFIVFRVVKLRDVVIKMK